MNAPVTVLLPESPEAASRENRPGWAADLRLCFLHIPKTAGTAFGAALAQRFEAAEIASTLRMAMTSGAADPLLGVVPAGFRLLGVGSHLDRDKLDAISAGLPAGQRLFTVTVLREPRARLISQYRHWRRSVDSSLAGLPDENREAMLAARHRPLGEFLAARIPFVVAHFRNMQARMITGLGSSELMDPATLADAARASLAHFDLVGTTDTVDDLLARIAEAYGWSPPDSVRPLNVAPGEPPALDAETEALIAEYTEIDRILWDDLHSAAAAPPPLLRPRYHQPDPALTATLLGDGAARFSMAQALDGQGWHVREGEGETLCRWTGPGRRSGIRLRAPQLRQVEVSLALISVLDWEMAQRAVLTLDGMAPLAPPEVEYRDPHPVLRARFDMPDAGPGQRLLAIEVPFTRSHRDIDASIDDDRQKGLAIGEITLRGIVAAAQPSSLGGLFWPGTVWADAPPGALRDLVPPCQPEAEAPAAQRNLIFDLPLLRGILNLVTPNHAWAALPGSILAPLERGTPLAWPAPGGSLVVLATLFEIASRGAPITALAARFEQAVLLLPCAEDFRLRQLAASPLLAPFLHVVGCTNGILVVNLAALRREGGAGRVRHLLLMLERIAATVPENLAQLRDEFGPTYALQQLDATLRGLEALNAGQAGTGDLLATLMLEPPRPAPTPRALHERGQALSVESGRPLALVDHALVHRLHLLLDQMLAASERTDGQWQAILAAQECAFRLTALLAGWQHFGLAGNATAQLAHSLRGKVATPPLYPKPMKPFGEYIDFYKAEARAMAAQPPAPGLVTRLDTLGGGLDHVTRLNQAAREVEVALRLLGDRFPGEEILWIDAGCSYGVIMNGVVPPANIAGRCAFLGFDFNAPGIEVARVAAGNLGNTHCRFEVGDVAEAKALADGHRIHLITAFEVLEHCSDPLAVLRGYRAMEPGMLVVGSPMGEPQSVFPAEQHVWGFDADGFAALSVAAGFNLIGLNQRRVGHYVGGHDWVTVTATTADPATLCWI